MDAILAAKETVLDITRRERVLGMTPSSYPTLSEQRRELEPFHELWNAMYDFWEGSMEWINGPFLAIDASDVKAKVKGWQRALHGMAKLFDGNHPNVALVASRLKEATTAFRCHLPLLIALWTNAMKAWHWERILDVLGVETMLLEVVESNELTFWYFLDSNIHDFEDKTLEICAAAKKEHGFKKSLALMMAEWDNVDLILVDHQDTSM